MLHVLSEVFGYPGFYLHLYWLFGMVPQLSTEDKKTTNIKEDK